MSELSTKILKVLKKHGTYIEPQHVARLVKKDYKTTYDELEKLLQTLSVKRNSKGKFILTGYQDGQIITNKRGTRFFVKDGLKMPISKKSSPTIIDGDKVVVDFSNSEAFVKKVISHEERSEVGEVRVINGQKRIILDSLVKRNINITLDKEHQALEQGMKVIVNVGALVKENTFSGQVIKVIGHKDSPGVDVISKAYAYDIEFDFPPEVMEEVKKIPTCVTEKDLKGRVDLREETIFTMDGESARDFDDAVSIKVLPNGNYLLGVHIADVAYYVKEGSAIANEAYKRGASAYFPDRVAHQLPEALANGICSLKENEDRLTKTCLMEIGKSGQVVNYSIFDSVIKSKKRMTYTQAQKVLENNSDEDYTLFQNDIILMNKASKLIRKRREQQGCLEFCDTEIKPKVDENGKVVDILKRTRIETEKIIEDFMILANVVVTSHYTKLMLPFMFRVHGEPDEYKLSDFFSFLEALGENTKEMPKSIHSEAIREVVNILKTCDNYEIYSNELLRSMKKAFYSAINIGHYALAEKFYTHFTSPIRRFPDLVVHWLIDRYKGVDKLTIKERENITQYLTDAAKHSSLRERQIDECGTEVTKMKCAEYMQDHIEQKFIGTITLITPSGLFIDIYNGVEGFVRKEDISCYYYNSNSLSINSKQGVFKIGDSVEVVVTSASKETSRVDLKLLKKVGKEKVYTKKCMATSSLT